jgi:hypothetical protein
MAAIKIWVFKLISDVILSFKVTPLWHTFYVKIEFFLPKRKDPYHVKLGIRIQNKKASSQ